MAGAVDAIDNFGMVGWACTDDRVRAGQIRVEVDGVPLAVFFPNDFRRDLAAAGWAKGYCSLDVSFPKAIALFESARVEVWNVDSATRISKPNLIIEPAIRKIDRYAFEDPSDACSANPTAVSISGETQITDGVVVFPWGHELSAERITGDAELVYFDQAE